jgi:hypothetical protein
MANKGFGSKVNASAMAKATATGKKAGQVGAVTKANNKESVNKAIAAPGKSNGASFKGLGAKSESRMMKDTGASVPGKKSHGSPSSGGPAKMTKKSLVSADKDKGHGKNKGSLTPPTV